MTLVYLKVILGQTGKLGTLKTCFWVVTCGIKTRFYTSQPPRIYQKRFEMHEGCVFLDAESDGTIYFSLSAEMAKIWAIFHLCRWFETTPGVKSPITRSFLQISRNVGHRRIQRQNRQCSSIINLSIC